MTPSGARHTSKSQSDTSVLPQSSMLASRTLFRWYFLALHWAFRSCIPVTAALEEHLTKVFKMGNMGEGPNRQKQARETLKFQISQGKLIQQRCPLEKWKIYEN